MELRDYKFFKRYYHIIKEFDREVERFVFLAEMPDLDKIKVDEGKPIVMKFEQAFNLKMVPGDKEILKDIYEFVNQNT